MFEGFKQRAAARQARRREQAEQRARRDRAAAAERAAHYQRIKTAGGVATVRLVCHGDTWRNISGLARPHIGWNEIAPKTSPQADEAGMVTVNLSGPQVALLLEVLHKRYRREAGWGGPQHVQAVSERYYEALASVIDAVTETDDPQAPVPQLTLDARPQAAQPRAETP